MEYRILGKTGLKISEIGFGAWAIGGSVEARGRQIGWANVNDSESIRTIHKALDLGVNFVDTSDAYGSMGKSEAIIGKALKGKRDKCIIATKVGKIRTPDRFEMDFSEKYVFSAVERSLKRLRTDVIDVYQLHGPSMNVIKNGGIFDTLEKLRKKGKIRFYGVSIESVEEGLEVISTTGSHILQLRYNILEQDVAGEVLPVAVKENVGIIAREPLASGFLTGKFTENTTFPETDWRHSLTSHDIMNTVRKVNKLRFLVSEDVKMMAQASLKFILCDQRISVVIVGAKTQKQIEDNLAASDSKLLSSEDVARIEDLYRNNFYLD